MLFFTLFSLIPSPSSSLFNVIALFHSSNSFVFTGHLSLSCEVAITTFVYLLPLSLSLSLFVSLSFSFSFGLYLCLSVFLLLFWSLMMTKMCASSKNVVVLLVIIIVVLSYQLKLIKMRAKSANLNHCAVPFLSHAAVNLCWYDYILIVFLFLPRPLFLILPLSHLL